MLQVDVALVDPHPRARPEIQILALGQLLERQLDRHHCAKREHPAEVARPDDKHQQHDRPATPDAECAMVRTQQKGVPLWPTAPPISGDETEWGAALIETTVLQPGELECSGGRQYDRA